MVRIQQAEGAFTNAVSLRACTLILKPLEQHSDQTARDAPCLLIDFEELNSNHSGGLGGNLLVL